MDKHRNSFSRDLKIRKRVEFDAVFEVRHRFAAGPILVFALPREGETRLGISMSRRVGTAARRNRIKRLLREAFRLHRHGWPAGLDIVVVPRPHDPLSLARYVEILNKLVVQAAGRVNG